MSRPFETVRTDRLAYLLGEDIPSYLHPSWCGVHQVRWWTDEPSLAEIAGKVSGCPCCSGEIPIFFLNWIESPRIKRKIGEEK